MTGCVAQRKYGRTVQDDTPRATHIQRCTYVEVRGGHPWQCLQGDPHPSGEGHRFPIDARFGKPLHTMHREQLAAHLRDQVAVTDHLQKRADTLQGVALDLLQAWVNGTPVKPDTAAWLTTNSPSLARARGLIE